MLWKLTGLCIGPLILNTDSHERLFLIAVCSTNSWAVAWMNPATERIIAGTSTMETATVSQVLGWPLDFHYPPFPLLPFWSIKCSVFVVMTYRIALLAHETKKVLWALTHFQPISILLAMSWPQPEELIFLFLLGKRNGHGLQKIGFPVGTLDHWPENKALLPETPSLGDLWELCSIGIPNGNFKLVICWHFASFSPLPVLSRITFRLL